MNENIEMLNYLYQIAEMSKDVIDQMLKEIKYLEFNDILRVQFENYGNVVSKADTILNQEARVPKGTNIMPETMAYFETKVNTLKDDSSTHIAEIITKGSTQVIFDITTTLNKSDHINNNTKDLARRILKMQQDNIETLKPFL